MVLVEVSLVASEAAKSDSFIPRKEGLPTKLTGTRCLFLPVFPCLPAVLTVPLDTLFTSVPLFGKLNGSLQVFEHWLSHGFVRPSILEVH